MRPRPLTRAAFIVAVIAALIAAFAPTYAGCGTSFPDGGTTCWRSSGFAENGWWILVVVSVPVVLTLIPVLAPRRGVRITAAVLLWLGCVVGLLSVGIFFVPAAILLTIAAAKREDPITNVSAI